MLSLKDPRLQQIFVVRMKQHGGGGRISDNLMILILSVMVAVQ